MARVRILNVYNSDKVFNLTFEPERTNDIHVSKENKNKIKQSIIDYAESQDDILWEKDDNYYVIDGDTVKDDELINMIFKYGGYIDYQTEIIIPAHIMDLVAKYRRNARATYLYNSTSPLSRQQINNIQLLASGSKTHMIINVTKDMTEFSLLNMLADLEFALDVVHLHFVDNQTPDEQYEVFNYLRDALSGWKINIFLQYKDEGTLAILKAKKEQDAKKRKGSRVWS